jgi:hypothetical protein
MPAGCHAGGVAGDGGALPFTGLDTMALVAMASIIAGRGVLMTTAGNIRTRALVW